MSRMASPDSIEPPMCGQRERSEYEKSLPEWVLNLIDAARGDYDIYGNKITREVSDSILRAWQVQR